MSERLGGEDQSCQQVVAGLQQRGHATLVLTSMHGTNNVAVQADGICRALYLEMDLVPWRNSWNFFTQRKAREQHNLECLERTVAQFEPDLIFIWGMWNLPRSLPALAETRYPTKVVYRFATYWPTLPSQHEVYWRAPGQSRYSRLAKQVLGRVALAMLARQSQPATLAFRNAICVSAATRQTLVEAGIPVANARVIHTGIDASRYRNGRQKPQPPHDSQVFHLLCAGRLYPEKGVHTAIQALEPLKLAVGDRRIQLSIAGSGAPEYEAYLRQLVTAASLDDCVSFLGHVPAEDMPQLLRQSDVLLIPSIWAEPFSRMLLEGMLSGPVVVATPTGGTPEILTDGENGLLFTPGNADELARKLICLAEDPQRRVQLALAGQRTVTEKFTYTRMMDTYETYLQEVISASVPAGRQLA